MLKGQQRAILQWILEVLLRSWGFILKGNEWPDLVISSGESFRINNVVLTVSIFFLTCPRVPVFLLN